MGAWDESIDGNDSAWDIRDEISGHIESGMNAREAFDKLKLELKMWTMDSPWHMLGLAHYQLEHLKKVDDDVLKLALTTIDEELERVDEWREPEKREEALLKFKEILIK